MGEAEAAAAIGLSPQAYANRERGVTELQLSEIAILAPFLDVSVDDFFAGLERDASMKPLDSTVLAAAEEIERFIQAMNAIPDARIRDGLIFTVRAISNATHYEEGDPAPGGCGAAGRLN